MLTSVAGWMLQMRNVMITTISEDYVVAAQAKGLSKRRIIYTYAARNALLPQLQGFGLALGFVVSGAAGHGDRLLLPGHRLTTWSRRSAPRTSR